jgi:hypothetical protein
VEEAHTLTREQAVNRVRDIWEMRRLHAVL